MIGNVCLFVAEVTVAMSWVVDLIFLLDVSQAEVHQHLRTIWTIIPEISTSSQSHPKRQQIAQISVIGAGGGAQPRGGAL